MANKIEISSKKHLIKQGLKLKPQHLYRQAATQKSDPKGADYT